jgi:hypothetical protein
VVLKQKFQWPISVLNKLYMSVPTHIKRALIKGHREGNNLFRKCKKKEKALKMGGGIPI